MMISFLYVLTLKVGELDSNNRTHITGRLLVGEIETRESLIWRVLHIQWAADVFFIEFVYTCAFYPDHVQVLNSSESR